MSKNRFLSLYREPHLYYFLSLSSCLLWLWNRLPFHNDILVYVYPERSFNLESLRQGLIPLWNPYITCGLPHLANWQSAFFYPPYWILNLTGLSKGLVWLTLLHSVWAYLGFYAWARSQKTSVWLAALGAFSFAGSAFFIHCWINLPFEATASWIPWVFWSFQKLTKNPRLETALGAVFILGLQLLAGYPVFVFYTWVTLLLWLLFQGLPGNFWRWAIFALGLSLLLTALQWLPFLDFLTFAVHGGWNDFPYYLHPKDWLTFLDPNILGVPGASDYRGNTTNILFGNLYFGFIPFFLWVLGLVWKKGKAGFWGIFSLGILAWMAAYGWGMNRFVPQNVFDFLEPSKALGLFLFASCSFLVLFLGRTLPDLWRIPAWKPWVILALVFWLTDLVFLPFRLTYRVPDPYQNPLFRQEAETIKAHADGLRILGLDMPYQMLVQSPQLDENLVKTTSEIFVSDFLPNTNQAWGIRSCNAYLSLDISNTQNIARYFNRGFPYPGDLLDVAGVRLILIPQKLPPPKYESVGKIGSQYLNLNQAASADIRFVPEESELPNRPSILNLLAHTGSGWRQKVFLEKSVQGVSTFLPPSQRSPFFQAVGRYSRPCGSRVSSRMDFTQSGYEVFNESYAPGWRAWVDGKPEPIFRAYGLFMAAAVPGPGSHQVDFRYEPASFRLGLFLTLLTFGFLGCAFIKHQSSSERPA